MAINKTFKRFGPIPKKVDSFAYSSPEQEAEAIRRKKMIPGGNHPQKESYVVYRVTDGLPIYFTHAVDYVQALLTGRFVKELSEIKEPEATDKKETIEGVEPISRDDSDFVIEDVEEYVKKS